MSSHNELPNQYVFLIIDESESMQDFGPEPMKAATDFLNSLKAGNKPGEIGNVYFQTSTFHGEGRKHEPHSLSLTKQNTDFSTDSEDMKQYDDLKPAANDPDSDSSLATQVVTQVVTHDYHNIMVPLSLLDANYTIPVCTFNPRGGTPMHDAILDTMKDHYEKSCVQVIVLTDGCDTTSHKTSYYTLIREMIYLRRTRQWNFRLIAPQNLIPNLKRNYHFDNYTSFSTSEIPFSEQSLPAEGLNKCIFRRQTTNSSMCEDMATEGLKSVNLMRTWSQKQSLSPSLLSTTLPPPLLLSSKSSFKPFIPLKSPSCLNSPLSPTSNLLPLTPTFLKNGKTDNFHSQLFSKIPIDSINLIPLKLTDSRN